MDKIDIHNTDVKYEQAIEKLKLSKKIRKENIELILNFISDSAIGKTAGLKARIKTVGVRARLKNIYLLKTVGEYFKKDFKELETKDIEKLIHALNENKIKKEDGGNYAEQTKSNIKKTFIIAGIKIFRLF